MSSAVTPAVLSEADMQTIHSVLFRAGYGAGSPVGGVYRYSTAAALLMRKVGDGERSPDVLERHLHDFYGRPTKYKVLYASLLPRFAIQGMPG
jgi:hypothetical protein